MNKVLNLQIFQEIFKPLKNKFMRTTKIITVVFWLTLIAFLSLSLGIYTPKIAAAAGMGLAIAPVFVSMKKPQKKCSMSGISTVLYVIPIEYIKRFPKIIRTENPESLVKLIGAYELKPNRYWTVLYSEKEMGELISESQGGKSGQFFNQTATAFYPDINETASGMAAILVNSDVIVLLKDLGGGKIRSIGSKDLPVTVTAKEASGKGFGDERGITFTFKTASCTPAQYYGGEIRTKDEVENLYSLHADDNLIDVAVTGLNVMVGRNTGTVNLTVQNLPVGDTLSIIYDTVQSSGAVTFTDSSYGGVVTLDAPGRLLIYATETGLIILEKQID